MFQTNERLFYNTTLIVKKKKKKKKKERKRNCNTKNVYFKFLSPLLFGNIFVGFFLL